MPRSRKPTYDAPGHAVGSWTTPVHVTASDWTTIEDSLARALSGEERARIIEFAERHAQQLRDDVASRMTPDDVRATLKALAATSYDGPTELELRERRDVKAKTASALLVRHRGQLPEDIAKRVDAIYRDIEEIDEELRSTPDALLARADTLTRGLVEGRMHKEETDARAAAAQVLRAGVVGKRGRDSTTAFMATSLLRLWADLGGPGNAIATKEGGYASPLVHFAAVLFRVAGAPPCDLPGAAARMRSAARGK